jgi:hypothetical protein
MKKLSYTIRLQAELLEKIREYALQDGRSVNNFIEWALTKAVTDTDWAKSKGLTNKNN